MAISISSVVELPRRHLRLAENRQRAKLQSDSTLSNLSRRLLKNATVDSCPSINSKVTIEKQASGSDQSVLAWKAQRFRFLPRKFNELRMVEVEPLLREYKHLASSCDQLLNERETLLARINELEKM